MECFNARPLKRCRSSAASTVREEAEDQKGHDRYVNHDEQADAFVRFLGREFEKQRVSRQPAPALGPNDNCFGRRYLSKPSKPSKPFSRKFIAAV
jgi:hypothetical protein